MRRKVVDERSQRSLTIPALLEKSGAAALLPHERSDMGDQRDAVDGAVRAVNVIKQIAQKN